MAERCRTGDYHLVAWGGVLSDGRMPENWQTGQQLQLQAGREWGQEGTLDAEPMAAARMCVNVCAVRFSCSCGD